MPDYDNELRGALFRVPEEKRTEKGPLYRGECEIRGQKYRISAWVQKSQQGRTYMSLSFTKDEGEYESKKVRRKDSQAPLERSKSEQRDREPGEDEDDKSKWDGQIPF